MAEALFEAGARARGLSFVVASMGTLMIEGRTPPPEVIEVLGERDIDVATRLSQGLRPAILNRADRVYVMEPLHLLHLRERAPEASARLLGELDDGAPAVADPIGMDLPTFRACRDRIEGCIERLVDELYQISADSGSRTSTQPSRSRTSHRRKA